MKITLFSSNQPRHLNLARELSSIADTVYFVSEVNTVFPGKIGDFFKKSEIMQDYFQRVIDAERKVFGETLLILRSTLPCAFDRSGFAGAGSFQPPLSSAPGYPT